MLKTGESVCEGMVVSPAMVLFEETQGDQR